MRHLFTKFVAFVMLLTVLSGVARPAHAQSGRVFAGFGWKAGASKQYAFVSTDGHIYEYHSVGGNQWQYADLTQITGAPSAVGSGLIGFSWEGGQTKQYAFVGNDGHVYELYVVAGSTWHYADLTQITGAPSADPSSLVGFAWESQQTKQYAFISSNGHVYELYVTAGSNWHYADLTQMTNAPGAAIPLLVGYVWENSQSKQYGYIGANGHVYELTVVQGAQWVVSDISQVASAPGATGAGFTGFAWEGGQTTQYAFLDGNGHIVELYLGIGADWQTADLTQMMNVSGVVDSTLDGYAWESGQSKQYAFLASNGHVMELHVASGGGWQAADLTQITRAPSAIGTNLVGFAWEADRSKQFAFFDSNNHVIEMRVVAGGTWQFVDVTKAASGK